MFAAYPRVVGWIEVFPPQSNDPFLSCFYVFRKSVSNTSQYSAAKRKKSILNLISEQNMLFEHNFSASSSDAFLMYYKNIYDTAISKSIYL